jgi:multiple sugar transport system substrate-binding protein
MNKRHWLLLTLGVVAALLLALSACAQPTPETIIETVVETVVVEKEVEGETVTVVETVVVEKEVEKVVTVEVEAAMEEAPENWAHLPMEETTTVVLSVESGAQEKTLASFHDELMEKLNIDLQVVAHPFSEQFEIQYLDLASRAGQFDVLSFWPVYTGDFAPFLEPLGNVSPGGADQVWVDLQMDDVQPAYLWSYQYKGDLYATQYDGDVKLLHYRHDLANDPDEIEAFKAEYGYEFDIDNLTWDQFLDVARFFTRPDEDFYGAGEIAGFLAGWFFRDRFVGSGGHYFTYDEMDAFPDMDVCVKAMQNGIDTFSTAAPPEAHSFEFEDARNQIIVHNRVMFVPQWPDVWKWAGDPNLSQAVCNVAVAEMPGFERDGEVIHRNEMNGGRVLAVNEASKAKEAAYKVLVFFSDKDRTAQLVNNNDTWLDPWRTTHMDPELYSHLCEGCEWNCDLYVDVIDKSTADGYPGLQIPGVGRYYEVQERWTKKAFAGQTTAEEACAAMKSEFDEITDGLGRDHQIAEHKRYVDEVLVPLGLWP